MTVPEPPPLGRAVASTRFRVAVLALLVVLGSGLGIPRNASTGSSPVPTPARMESTEGWIFRRGPLSVPKTSRVVVTHPSLHGVAGGWVERFWTRTDRKIERITGDEERSGADGDFVLILDRSLPPEGYSVDVRDQIRVTGGSPAGVAWGLSSVLQLLERTEAGFRMPRVKIYDQPRFHYRGLRVDVASRPYTVEEIKELILLCHLFRVRFLTLDVANQRAALIPWDGREGLRSWRGFSRTDLERLDSYAGAQGVTLVPGLSLPFGAHSLLSGPSGLPEAPGSPGRLHLAQESTYQALDSLVTNLKKLFPASPYIAVNASGLDLTGFFGDSGTRKYMEHHRLESVDELVPHFLTRFAGISAERGLRLVVESEFFRNAWSPTATTRPIGPQAGSAKAPRARPAASIVLALSGPIPAPAETFGFTVDVVDSRHSALTLGWDDLGPPQALQSWAPTASDQGRLWGGQLTVKDLHAFLAAPLITERMAFVSQGLWSGSSWADSPRATLPALDRMQQVVRALTRPAAVAFWERTPRRTGGREPNDRNQFATEAVLRGRPLIPGDRLLMTDDGRLPDERDLIPDSVNLAEHAALRFRVVDAKGVQRGFPWTSFFERRPVALSVEGGLGGPPSGPDGEVVSYFVDSVGVTVHRAPATGLVRYTVDGSAPSPVSPEAGDVIRLQSSAQVRVRAFDQFEGGPSPVGLEARARLIQLARFPHAAVGAPSRLVGEGISLGDPGWVVDGVAHPRQAWEAAAGDTTWLELDLGTPVVPASVTPWTTRSGGGSPGWRLEGSLDRDNWTVLGIVAPGPNAAIGVDPGATTLEAKTVRWIRFRFEGNPDGERIRLSELVVTADSTILAQPPRR